MGKMHCSHALTFKPARLTAQVKALVTAIVNE